jgi:hypothetical protein
MTLLDRILARGLVLPADPIMAARLERHVRRIQPDPLFRRRLRSVVVNRYVAAQEGLAAPPLPRASTHRQMGALGRGVLYASLLTAIGTSAVGAASQESLPGDALYGVKIQLEQVRIRVAPPGLRDDLAAMALDERLDELEQLASAGRWELLDEAATRAEAAEAQLEALMGGRPLGGAASTAALQQHIDRIEALLRTAPAPAMQGLERALEVSSANSGAANPPREGGDHPQPAQPQKPAEGSQATHGTPGGGHAVTTPPPAPTPAAKPSDPVGEDEDQQGGGAQGVDNASQSSKRGSEGP